MAYALAVIGAGNMAEAIVRGILRAGKLDKSQIIAADPSPVRREVFSTLGVATVEKNIAAAAGADVVLLSVKPQQIAEALAELSGALEPETLLISIAAGVSTRYIETTLGGDIPWRVIRTMPNTPMLVGAGVVGLCRGKNAAEADAVQVRGWFSCAAEVIDVSESHIDAVTAVSGSGPAYIFFLVEQMIAAGVELGLPEPVARKLAIGTAAGAATMLVESPDSPQELRRKVTSPRGTTHAAITVMEEGGWPALTRQALAAAAQRSKELGL